jgi:hypothetical protein
MGSPALLGPGWSGDVVNDEVTHEGSGDVVHGYPSWRPTKSASIVGVTVKDDVDLIPIDRIGEAAVSQVRPQLRRLANNGVANRRVMDNRHQTVDRITVA